MPRLIRFWQPEGDRHGGRRRPARIGSLWVCQKCTALTVQFGCQDQPSKTNFPNRATQIEPDVGCLQRRADGLSTPALKGRDLDVHRQALLDGGRAHNRSNCVQLLGRRGGRRGALGDAVRLRESGRGSSLRWTPGHDADLTEACRGRSRRRPIAPLRAGRAGERIRGAPVGRPHRRVGF